MTNGCPRPRMRWNGAIGAIARCKKVSTVCAPKSRSRHELRLICGEKPGARGVATLFTPYMRHGQDESNPVSLLQCQLVPPFEVAFQAHMAAWRLDGKPRTARRFSVYQNCPLPTPEDRLFFLLTYLRPLPSRWCRAACSACSRVRPISGSTSSCPPC